MIKSANQHPVFSLISHEGNTHYRVPPYQREYSWQKPQWEELFDDLVESESAHFLGTIICLNSTTDTVEANVLELIDGQQRMTTITLLLAAIHAVLEAHKEDLDDDSRADLANLRRQLIRKQDGQPRLRPQRQGHNLADYVTILNNAGLPVDPKPVNYRPLRKVARCFAHFQSEISDYAVDQGIPVVEAAQRILSAVSRAIIVKIEVDTHADAFVLFESLNNRGMPLTPVDLIKNHLLAESERRNVMDVDAAFKEWNTMLSNLGDNYATQERFLRHYYNAFKGQLPPVAKATLATRSNLIRIYEVQVAAGVRQFLDGVVPASAVYGRISGRNSQELPLDRELTALARAQGAPSYVLLLFLMVDQAKRRFTDDDLVAVTRLLTNFFVRRNLTGFPQTYALPRIFMDIIDELANDPDADVSGVVLQSISPQSVTDDAFRERLLGPVYEDNSDVTRFILTSLAEDAMTKENTQDLWGREKNHYVWTIEHILPQGQNLPPAWQQILGGAEAARQAQDQHVHRLGNLTITGYNSSLGNKSFEEKKQRTDAKGNSIGFKNGLKLNEDVVSESEWTVKHIDRRTEKIAQRVLDRFPLSI
ncbi:DUF262 domain-containing protein [Nocardioides sp. Root140]|uniref:DUF262 domain-containing protein n=1 Tax=Nocardioides sp. Root140 TaxID=1736460 RepID=UPI0006F51081|nr:DUF262 domain-containing protein [Nocardioides sp. Root140]KQY51560.1 hypothetical protein ASD30_19500 [Nocardioides sp. Root140]